MRSRQGKEVAPSLVTQWLGLDLRSLALLRVAIGAVVLADVLLRATDLSAHYTDAGVLRRSDVLETFPWLHAYPLCLHLVSGAWWGQALLFGLHGVAALALTVGYRTRLATFVVWLLTASVQLRNLYIGHGSDAQLRMILLWGIFLPLGARYSVDSALRWSAPHDERQQTLSVATVALLAQVVIIYLGTGYAKILYPWWQDGTAVSNVFDNEIWGTHTGSFLLQFPLLCTVLTHLTIVLELGGPLLLFSPVAFGPIRTATLLALGVMHLGFASAMRVGIFPFTSIASLFALLPGWFWEQILPRLRTAERLGARVTFHGECRLCSRCLLLLRTFFLLPETPLNGGARGMGSEPATWVVIDGEGRRHVDTDALLRILALSPLLWPLHPLLQRWPLRPGVEILWRRYAHHAQDGPSQLAALAPRPAPHLHRLAKVACGVLLLFVVVWNIGVARDATYTPPAWIGWLGESLFLQQDWRMYSRVDTRTGWIAIPGQLRNGTSVDLFKLGGPVPPASSSTVPEASSLLERPEPLLYRVRNYRWLAMMHRMVHRQRGEQQLLQYGRYLCREWNARQVGDMQLETFEIIFMSRPVRAQAGTYRTDDYDKEVLWQHWCFR